MASRGRPPLRIGQHGKIGRRNLGAGVWEASCRYRDTDGVTRKVQRLGRADEFDRTGKLAEDALIEALAERRAPGTDEIGLNTLVMALVGQHIDRLAEDGKALRTLDTYRYDAKRLGKFIAGVRVSEATPPRLDAALRSMRTAHGATTARRARSVLRGGLQLAVMAGALPSNPLNDVQIKVGTKPKGAVALDAAQLPELLAKLAASEACQRWDLADPIALLIATGLRRSELLGLRWSDFDAKAGTISVAGKVVRASGTGLIRVDEAKSDAGLRTVPLPPFAVATLVARRKREGIGKVIFASSTGTLRDPDNFNHQWRKVRNDLGVPDVTSHSFRKTVATLIDDAGLSARIGADQLGHSRISMTQDKYMARGRVHQAVADAVQQAVSVPKGHIGGKRIAADLGALNAD